MLDQENQTKAEGPTINGATDNSNGRSNEGASRMSTTNGVPIDNPLSDHDYCSPSKTSTAPVEPVSETREKRQRKEVHDPEFSHYTSSDYSSSDAGSDQESEEYDEGDPNRPWCNCNRPDDGKFMISCDICMYWFHGSCVGVVESLSKRWSKEGKEWYCPDCEDALANGTPRSAIPRKIVKKPKNTAKPAGKRRGRPRKTSVQAREASARLSLRSSKRMNHSLDSRTGTRNSSNKSAGSESFNEFEHPDRLKELIRERRKAFFLKHRLSEQVKAEKMKEMGVGRRSVTASLGDSLDSLVSSTNSPNMNNLPINIKSEHKERSKPNIVLQINTKKDSSVESGGQRLVTTIVKKRKHSETSDSNAGEVFTTDPLQVGKKPKKTKSSATPISPSAKTSGNISPGLNDSQASGSQSSKSMQKLVASEQSASKRKRKDSDSNSSSGPQNLLGPKQMVKMIYDTLESRSRKLDIKIPSEKIEALANEIQQQLAECYKEGSPKCINKFRSLIFNLRDLKNEVLLTNVLNGEIIPSKLVRMSHDDMASNELSKWRERENKHSIELIKRDAQLAAEEVIVKKTHKGEEVISASHNDNDNPASSANTNQDLPTTPTKTSIRPEPSKIKSPHLMSSDDASRSNSASTSSAVKSESPSKSESVTVSTGELPSSSADPLALLDKTEDHANHIFDIGCKICTKQTIENEDGPSGQQTDNVAAQKESQAEKPQDQPKRLRISIETKLDPSNLSRLREPLVRPTEQSAESEFGLSKASPTASPNADPVKLGEDDNVKSEADDDEELYDPETSTLMPPSDRNEFGLSKAPASGVCWTGSINMQDTGKFNAMAKSISGDASFIQDRLSSTLNICGRIAPDQVSSYIKLLKSTTKNQILLVQLHPHTENDKSSFDAFFDYLYTRNRCAVINCSANSQLLKDFYILPVHQKSSIPEVLKPINGPGLDRTDPNCLLGLLVKTKRPH